MEFPQICFPFYSEIKRYTIMILGYKYSSQIVVFVLYWQHEIGLSSEMVWNGRFWFILKSNVMILIEIGNELFSNSFFFLHREYGQSGSVLKCSQILLVYVDGTLGSVMKCPHLVISGLQ